MDMLHNLIIFRHRSCIISTLSKTIFKNYKKKISQKNLSPGDELSPELVRRNQKINYAKEIYSFV